MRSIYRYVLLVGIVVSNSLKFETNGRVLDTYSSEWNIIKLELYLSSIFNYALNKLKKIFIIHYMYFLYTFYILFNCILPMYVPITI